MWYLFFILNALKMSFAICFILNRSKILPSGNGLKDKLHMCDIFLIWCNLWMGMDGCVDGSLWAGQFALGVNYHLGPFYWKGQDGYLQWLFFPQFFPHVQKPLSLFEPQLPCRLYMLWREWTLKFCRLVNIIVDDNIFIHSWRTFAEQWFRLTSTGPRSLSNWSNAK